MHEKKKRYLKQYLLQQAVIKRLEQLKTQNPDKKDFYTRKIKTAKALRNIIEAKVEALPDDNLREVLYNKYILGQTLEEISFTLNYSKRHIERLHVKALEKFTL